MYGTGADFDRQPGENDYRAGRENADGCAFRQTDGIKGLHAVQYREAGNDGFLADSANHPVL